MSKVIHAPIHRLIARPVSYVYLGVAGAMAACAGICAAFEAGGYAHREIDEGSVVTMAGSAALAAAVGGLTWFWGKDAPVKTFGRREATFAVAAIWFGVSVLGAVPFVIDSGISPADAIFESVSGFTTTGATIVSDIEGTMSRPILLWRSIMQWLGGMGIVVLFVAVFPQLGVSGKHMFRSEVPGVTAEGLQPRITETSLVLWRFYVVFTAINGVAFYVLGMNGFESLCHAFTNMATGGFSTRNDSIAAFDSPAIEYTVIFFMLLSTMNFGLFYGIWRSRRVSIVLKSVEFRVYGIVVVLATLLVTLGILGNHDNHGLEAFRAALFTVSATISSTGYTTTDYMAWSSPALLIFVFLQFSGGCAGSTAGGIKLSRFILLAKISFAQLRRSVRPQVISVVRMDRKVLADSVLLEVSTFIFLYLICMAVGSLVVAYTDGLGLDTTFGGMLSALSNMGPAAFHDGPDNFARYSPAAKLIFSLAMIMGRLEFFTILALLTPDLWRR